MGLKSSPTPSRDEAIGPGDFVVVIRGCCDRAMQRVVGLHATVLRLYDDPGRLCIFCEADLPTKRAELDHAQWNSPVAWLKKVPPLDEPADVKREEEITV